MIIKGPESPISVQEGLFHETILRFVWKHGNKTALVNSDTNESYSYRDVYSLSYSMATYLEKYGFGKGDVGVVCMRNRPEFCISFLAIALRGGVTSGTNPDYHEHELMHHFRDSGAKIIITEAAALSNVLKVTNVLKAQIKIVICVSPNMDTLPKGVINFDEVIQTIPKPLPNVQLDSKTDLVLLPYSSGTTGRPKGVMLTHYNLVSMVTVLRRTLIEQLKNIEDMDTANPSPNLGVKPYFHMAGFFYLMNNMVRGATHICISKFHKEKFLSLMQHYRVQSLSIVPSMVSFLAKISSVDKYDLSRLRFVMVGAAPLGKELSLQFCRRFPKAFLFQGYGMTELCLVCTLTPIVPVSQIRYGSVGTVTPNTEIKVIDVESGKELEANKAGEICVRNKMVMKGYLHQPKATNELIDKDNWLHTGDIGYFDDDGYFYIVDRIKELIKVKGFPVAPAELEDLLLTHPSVDDAAVVGVPDDVTGEKPKAYIVLKPRHKVSAENIRTFVDAQVAPYKQLSGGVKFLSEIPKNAAGKILRRMLKETAKKSKI